MDLTFFRRAEQRLASRTAALPDFGTVVAMLQAQQAAGAAARAQGLWAAAERVPDPLAEILLAGPCWRGAVAAQRGCFNAGVARQGSVN